MSGAWDSYIADRDRSAYLEGLTVSRTTDEFGVSRYFVTSPEGDWLGDAWDDADLAFAQIDYMRREDA